MPPMSGTASGSPTAREKRTVAGQRPVMSSSGEPVRPTPVTLSVAFAMTPLGCSALGRASRATAATAPNAVPTRLDTGADRSATSFDSRVEGTSADEAAVSSVSAGVERPRPGFRVSRDMRPRYPAAGGRERR